MGENRIKDLSRACKNLKIRPQEAIMIGDSSNDYLAAIENQIQFILRKTGLNKNLQKQLKCKSLKDLD